MTQTAKVIADSISPQDIRLTTMQLRYPKFIHGGAKTHRVMRIGDKAYEFLEEVGFMDYPKFSRNASSSRAIPVERLIQDVLDDPAMPVYWGSNKPGMQAGEECNEWVQDPRIKDEYYGSITREQAWLTLRDQAVDMARAMSKAGYHKQIVNRLIEPWCHINVVVTATEWANFYALRRHKDAQPEMRALADAMWEAQQASTPKLLQPGEWHLPYVDTTYGGDLRYLPLNPTGDTTPAYLTNCLIKLCVARCARVSYLTHEGKPPNVEEDLKLYDRLVVSAPLHASPAEHQATPDEISGPIGHSIGFVRWKHPHQHGNFVGWRQYRKMLPNESVRG
jgi:Thymidylate synthase complementing protein